MLSHGWGERGKPCLSARGSTKSHTPPGTYGAKPVSNQRFISTFAGTLDGKGRVCIPASWRTILAAQETGGVYLRPTLDGDCLDGFGQAQMDLDCAWLDQLVEGSPLYEQLASHITGDACHLPIDENGRVRLPEDLIARIGLKERVSFVGLGRKFQVWDPEAYAAVKALRDDVAKAERAARAAKELAERIPGFVMPPRPETGTP